MKMVDRLESQCRQVDQSHFHQLCHFQMTLVSRKAVLKEVHNCFQNVIKTIFCMPFFQVLIYRSADMSPELTTKPRKRFERTLLSRRIFLVNLTMCLLDLTMSLVVNL